MLKHKMDRVYVTIISILYQCLNAYQILKFVDHFFNENFNYTDIKENKYPIMVLFIQTELFDKSLYVTLRLLFARLRNAFTKLVPARTKDT